MPLAPIVKFPKINRSTVMFRAFCNLLDGLLWGFSMAFGWILAFGVAGLILA
jgi:hypothetical protein